TTMLHYRPPTRVVLVFSICRGAILKLSGWRWPMRIVLIATVLVIVGAGCVPLLSPAVAAYACPSCYGLLRLTGSLFVDPAMSVEGTTKLQETISRATVQVAAFYGSFEHAPTLLVCATKECDHRLGGKGAKANTYGTTFIRVSPDGLNQTILAH